MPANRRCGFTLTELLIVIVIMLILATMTMSAVNLSVNNDKVRAAARQVQSALAGARDRAIYAKEPRGLRFLLDPTNNRTVSSVIYIQPTPPWTQGQIQLERLDVNNDAIADEFAVTPQPLATVVRGFDNDPNNPNATPTNWNDLIQQGLLTTGARIKIPNDPTGTWYTITTELLPNATASGVLPYYPPRLHLTTSYLNSPTNTNGQQINAFISGGPMTYMLELPNGVLPGADALTLPKGAVIHLDRCTTVRGTPGTAGYINGMEQQDAASLAGIPAPGHRYYRGDRLPQDWTKLPTTVGDTSGFDYTTNMDIMYSPRGVVIGNAAGRGIIELYIADQKDADRDRSYWQNPGTYPTDSPPEYGAWTDASGKGYERGDKVVVTIFTRTGHVLTGSIAPDTIVAGSQYRDPFKFAENGEVAGK